MYLNEIANPKTKGLTVKAIWFLANTVSVRLGATLVWGSSKADWVRWLLPWVVVVGLCAAMCDRH